jgi:hypothetical protein
MIQEHPITPPEELVAEWWSKCTATSDNLIGQLATQAARWGADQELEACVEWMGDSPVVWRGDPEEHPGSYLREARRPKPPNLKELALEVLDDIDARLDAVHYNILRRAIEFIPD